VIVEELSCEGGDGPQRGAVLVVLNANQEWRALSLPYLGGRHWRLHPVHLAPHAGDARIAKEARVDDARGHFVVPARSATVFVAD